MSKHLGNVLIAIFISISFAFFGGLLVSEKDISEWYLKLNQPSFGLTLHAWYVVAIIYYILLAVIIYRILSMKKATKWYLLLIVNILMFYNELWNYLFIGLRSAKIGFISLLPFSLLAIYIEYQFIKNNKTLAFIFSIYLFWLVYDLFWSYHLWLLNS